MDRQPRETHELYERARAAREQSAALAERLGAAQRDASEFLRLAGAAQDRAEQVRALWLGRPDAGRVTRPRR